MHGIPEIPHVPVQPFGGPLSGAWDALKLFYTVAAVVIPTLFVVAFVLRFLHKRSTRRRPAPAEASPKSRPTRRDGVIWKDVAANTPHYVWTVEVSSPGQADAVHKIPFPDTAETDGLIIATALPCHVLIPDKTLPPTRARIRGLANHLFVDVDQGTVHFYNREVVCHTRFDGRPLTFGEYTVHVVVREPGEEFAPA